MDEVFYRVSTKAGVGRYVVNETEFSEIVDGLLHVRSKRELTDLLKDLLTTREQAEVIRRWLVGRMIFNGATYEDITERTGMSAPTIAEISQRLLNGSGVFAKILERTPHKVTDNELRAHRQQRYIKSQQRSPIDRKFRKMINPLGE